MSQVSGESSGKQHRKRATGAGTNLGGPPHLQARTTDELEALLRQRLEDGGPGIEATPEFWARLKKRARHSAAGAEPDQ
jgi:hypothetical protein